MYIKELLLKKVTFELVAPRFELFNCSRITNSTINAAAFYKVIVSFFKATNRSLRVNRGVKSYRYY